MPAKEHQSVLFLFQHYNFEANTFMQTPKPIKRALLSVSDKLGIVESNQITCGSDLKISIDDIKESYKNWLKEYMVN